jgi:excisionase family DNA binding protein
LTESLSLHRPEQWPEVLSVAQVASLLSISPSVVRRAITHKQLDGVLVGGQWRIAAPSVWPLVPASIRAHWPEGPWNEWEIEQE